MPAVVKAKGRKFLSHHGRSLVLKNRWPSWYHLAVCTTLVAACSAPTEPNVHSGLAYVTTLDGGALWVIDTQTHEVISQHTGLFGAPRDVRIAPDNAFLYVADAALNRVHVLKTEDNGLVEFVHVGESPSAVDSLDLGSTSLSVGFMPAGGIAYITSGRASGQVLVVDTETLELIRTVEVGLRPWGVVFSRTPGAE